MAEKDAQFIRQKVMEHNKWFEESIPMIASENLMSPLAKEMLISDFADRYAEGLPGKRYYQGNIYVDQVELKTIELAKKVFDADFADVRPISGTVANMAVLFAFAEPGDTITTCALAQGAHISTCEFGAFGQRAVKSVNYPFNEHDMNLDIDGTIKLLKEVKPKIAQFGLSVFLFPPPLKELQDTFNEIGCLVWEDCAHVLGLIAGKQFHDPLREGVNIVSSSTHKTFPGPNHGMLLGANMTDEQEKKLQKAVFPGVTSSHHLHAMAALGITLALPGSRIHQIPCDSRRRLPVRRRKRMRQTPRGCQHHMQQEHAPTRHQLRQPLRTQTRIPGDDQARNEGERDG